MESTTTKPDPIAVLNGVSTSTAVFVNGATEEVQIRHLPVRKFVDYAKILDDEPARIELATGNEPGWADNLTPASHVELLAACDAANSTNFFAWLERRVHLAGQLGGAAPGGKEAVKPSPSPTTSPTSLSRVG